MTEYLVYNLTQGNLLLQLPKKLSEADLNALPRHKRHKAVRTANNDVTVQQGGYADLLKKTDLSVEELEDNADLQLMRQINRVKIRIVQDQPEEVKPVEDVQPVSDPGPEELPVEVPPIEEPEEHEVLEEEEKPKPSKKKRSRIKSKIKV